MSSPYPHIFPMSGKKRTCKKCALQIWIPPSGHKSKMSGGHKQILTTLVSPAPGPPFPPHPCTDILPPCPVSRHLSFRSLSRHPPSTALSRLMSSSQPFLDAASPLITYLHMFLLVVFLDTSNLIAVSSNEPSYQPFLACFLRLLFLDKSSVVVLSKNESIWLPLQNEHKHRAPEMICQCIYSYIPCECKYCTVLSTCYEATVGREFSLSTKVAF
jgi:hypothetical protein